MGLLPPIITKNKPKKQCSTSKLNDSESVTSKISIITKLEPKVYIAPSKKLNSKVRT